MKKIFLILILTISNYGLATEIEVTTIPTDINGAKVSSICIFPSETERWGFLFLYIQQNGVQENGFKQVKDHDTSNGAKFASCERKTK